MNCTLNKIMIFMAGAAVGTLATWKVIKTKYEKIAQEEIESVKQVYSYAECGKAFSEGFTDAVKGAEKEEAPEEYIPTEKDLYSAMVEKAGYVNYSDIKMPEVKTKEEVEEVEKPYVIPPEEFGEFEDYERIGLTYYADGALATDDTDELVDDVESIIGVDSLDHFGEYEDDAVHVRNDRLKCDYEILKDMRNYTDIVG